jgi:hypothetical protein
MLKSIDVLVSLTVVLLALSMAVTVITQTITTIINSRGSHLKRGLVDMLQQLDPRLTQNISGAVADAILRHPLVSASSVPFLNRARLGNVIHREEFTKLIMAVACGGTGVDGAPTLEKGAKDALVEALKSNGVPDPEATLRNVRTAAMQLERTAPALSHPVRQAAALLQAGESDLVAKINGWFDQTMDRVSQRFTASTRVITFLGGFAVAFGLQVDTPMLFNRLSADDVLRDRLVAEAQNLPAIPMGDTAADTTSDFNRKYRDFLAESGVISLPSGENYFSGFRIPSKLGGMFVTALLLSLGAPFWYGALSNLLQLRSVLAGKDDAQRNERQGDQSTTGAAPPKNATPPSLVGG